MPIYLGNRKLTPRGRAGTAIAETFIGRRTVPQGRTTTFADRFDEPVTGTIGGYPSWQGIDRSKWQVKGEVFEAEDGHKADPPKNYMSTEHAMATPARGLLLFGGERADGGGAGWPLSNDDRRKAALSTRQTLLAPPAGGGPMIVRTRTAWELPAYYNKHLWTFAEWTDYDVGGQTFSKNIEIDMESGPDDYRAGPVRRLQANWNLHLWHRISVPGGLTPSTTDCYHSSKTWITLPDAPLAPLTIELRIARGSDFYDPTQTYVEWWVENVRTGRMERHYHASPRSDLEARRGSVDWGFDAGVPAAEPLPPALAAVAPNPFVLDNWFHDDDPVTGAPAVLGLADLAAVAADPTWGPYHAIGAQARKPYSAGADPSQTWLDFWDEVLNASLSSRFILHGGFQGSEFFLQPAGDPVLADYTAHPTHMDDVRAVASPISSVEVFGPVG